MVLKTMLKNCTLVNNLLMSTTLINSALMNSVTRTTIDTDDTRQKRCRL